MNEWNNHNKQRENYIKQVKDIRKRARINQIMVIIFGLLILVAILLTIFK